MRQNHLVARAANTDDFCQMRVRERAARKVISRGDGKMQRQ